MAIKNSTRKATHYVYFIQSGFKSVKIGVSQNIQSRLETMQTGNPERLELIGCIPKYGKASAYNTESILHSKYAGMRVNGEWFSRDIISFLYYQERDIEWKMINIRKFVENRKRHLASKGLDPSKEIRVDYSTQKGLDQLIVPVISRKKITHNNYEKWFYDDRVRDVIGESLKQLRSIRNLINRDMRKLMLKELTGRYEIRDNPEAVKAYIDNWTKSKLKRMNLSGDLWI